MNRIYKKASPVLLLFFLLSTGCSRKPHQQPVKLLDQPQCFSWNEATQQLTIFAAADQKEIIQTLRLNADGPESGPVKKAALFSTTYHPMFDILEARDRVSAVDDSRYSSSAWIHKGVAEGQIIETGPMPGADLEKLMAAGIDALFIPRYALTPAAEKMLLDAGIRCFFFQEWLETSPLARAAWIEVAGRILGEGPKSLMLQSEIEKRYRTRRTTITAEIQSGEKAPLVLTGLPWQGQWAIPEGGSYMARLIRDAGGRTLFDDSIKSGSRLLDPESVIIRSTGAKIWLINSSGSWSCSQVSHLNPLFSRIEALHQLNLFNNNRRTTRQGGNDFYESGLLNPDIILNDLREIIRATQQSQPINEEVLYYYRKLHP